MNYNCKTCGKSFIAVNKRIHSYCSNKCKYESRRIFETNKPCINCGKIITRKPNGRVIKFCSRKCCTDNNAKNGKFKKENNPNWKGGISREPLRKDIVKLVWKRDDYSCVRCGERKIKKEQCFHIHHIVSYDYEKLRHNPVNLILVCAKCHHWIHSSDNIHNNYIEDYKYYETIKKELE